MSSTEIEALRERIRREKLLVDAERAVFDRSVPPPLADEQTEPKPSLDLKTLLRLRSPMDIARPKKPSFGDMPGQAWPPKIDVREPIVISRGLVVAARKKRRESRHDKS